MMKVYADSNGQMMRKRKEILEEETVRMKLMGALLFKYMSANLNFI
jgi:hypothetical protein